MGRCQRLTLTEGSCAAARVGPMTPPPAQTRAPPHMNGEGFDDRGGGARGAMKSVAARPKANPPHSYGEVSASYADGGVMRDGGCGASDPSVADYRATSPHEW